VLQLVRDEQREVGVAAVEAACALASLLPPPLRANLARVLVYEVYSSGEERGGEQSKGDESHVGEGTGGVRETRRGGGVTVCADLARLVGRVAVAYWGDMTCEMRTCFVSAVTGLRESPVLDVQCCAAFNLPALLLVVRGGAICGRGRGGGGGYIIRIHIQYNP